MDYTIAAMEVLCSPVVLPRSNRAGRLRLSYGQAGTKEDNIGAGDAGSGRGGAAAADGALPRAPRRAALLDQGGKPCTRCIVTVLP
jgi:hypothetical protein